MVSKKNKIIASVVIAGLVVAGSAFAIVKSNSSDLKLKDKEVEVEYGKAVSTNPEDYLDLEKVKDKDTYLKEVTVTKDTKLEKGKKYEALGDYEVVIKDKEDEATVKVTVKDTTKPKFNKVDKIETFKGEKINYKKFIKAKDLQKVKLAFDEKEVKLSKTGKYVLKVTATDLSDNKAEKEIKVIVKAKPKTNSNEKIETVVDKKGNVVSKVVDKDSSSSVQNSSNSKPSRPSYNKPSSNNGSSSSTNVNRPSNKPSKPHKPSKPSKPSNDNPIFIGLGNSGWKGEKNTLYNRAEKECLDENSKWYMCGFEMWTIDKNGTIWTVNFYR